MLKVFQEERVLKPFPFCGGKAYFAQDDRLWSLRDDFPKWFISCRKCGVETPTATRQHVMEMWNKRIT